MRFEPDAWTRSAAVFSEVAGSVTGAFPPAPSASGPTQTDAAVAKVTSQLTQVITAYANGVSAGLNADADVMNQTAARYAATEQTNTAAGGRATQAV